MPGDASLLCKSTYLMQSSTENLAGFYRHVLLEDVMPFWLHHGMNATHGGILRFWIGCGKEDGMLRGLVLLSACPQSSCAGVLARHEILVAA